MKNLSTLFILLAALAPAAYAQSTCEIRVDRNLDKTTLQKVEYCLTPESEPVGPEPQVVYFASYDSRAPRPVKRKIPREIVQPGIIYHEEALSKNREYWDAAVYPLFTNDIPSSQDEREVNEAVLELFPGASFDALPTATRIIMYRNGRDGKYRGPLTVYYGGKEFALKDNGDGTFSIPGAEDASGQPLTGYFAYEPTPGARNRAPLPAHQPSVNLGSGRGNPYFPAQAGRK